MSPGIDGIDIPNFFRKFQVRSMYFKATLFSPSQHTHNFELTLIYIVLMSQCRSAKYHCWIGFILSTLIQWWSLTLKQRLTLKATLLWHSRIYKLQVYVKKSSLFQRWNSVSFVNVKSTPKLVNAVCCILQSTLGTRLNWLYVKWPNYIQSFKWVNST